MNCWFYTTCNETHTKINNELNDDEFTFPNFLIENQCKKQRHLLDRFVHDYSFLRKYPYWKVIPHSWSMHSNIGRCLTIPMQG